MIINIIYSKNKIFLVFSKYLYTLCHLDHQIANFLYKIMSFKDIFWLHLKKNNFFSNIFIPDIHK